MQQEWWKGEGGNAYLERNRVDWQARVPFWQTIMARTQAKNIMELGSNAGWNLRAIEAAAESMVMLTGWDVNYNATVEANKGMGPLTAATYLGTAHDALTHHGAGTFDLTFTAGVLIHIPSDHLAATMSALAALSKRYVLAIEYEADQETEIEYRGKRDLLWKRPYGHLYRDLGLRFIDAWRPEHVVGFDNCTAWLMEKRQ